ncbi:tyrosine-type recombinase/integrase [Streptomyces sp. CA-106131]|uniref:tyrosine-type recombinase/integrase n=1 Tax=Streptomyces sp. CA-106131 TaxID=3240045 RepID=UPI003D93457E
MTAAVNNGLRASSPCRGVKLPRIGQTHPTILTTDQVERLINELPGQHRVLVMLLAYAGLRLGEAFALRRSGIDLDRCRIVVASAVTEINGRQVFGTPKSHQRREIAVPAFVAAELRIILNKLPDENDPLIFTGERLGKPLRYGWWRAKVFDLAAERAGLVGVTPKDLRATHATWVADRLGVMAAAKRLGHSNASVTTRHYARAVEAREDEAAKILGAMRDETLRARSGHDGDDDGSAGAAAPA